MKKSFRFLAWDPKSCSREERHAARVFWAGHSLERLLVLAVDVEEIGRVLGDHHEVILNVERRSPGSSPATVPVVVTTINPPQVCKVFENDTSPLLEVEFDDQEMESLQAGRSGRYAAWVYAVHNPQGQVPRNLAMIRGPGFEVKGVVLTRPDPSSMVTLRAGEKITLQIGPAQPR